MSAEQAIFKGLYDKAVLDTGTGGLFEISGSTPGANYLTGGFRLEGDSTRERSEPRIEVIPPDQDRMDASGLDVWDGLWRIRAIVKRDRAYGTGDTPEAAGVLSGIMDRIEAVFDKATITVSGYTPCTLSIVGVRRGPETAHMTARTVEFRIVAHE